jgi:serine/tyrosine/threonine adenylyltransferase
VAAMFHEVCQRTATLMVHWMRVGFVHGVMNTDNLSILGLTIDYGPYGWLEDFDPTWTPNTTDASGRRYRYGAQPQVAHWNLLQLANALVALTGDADPLQQALDGYATAYGQQFEQMMATRLGWGAVQPGDDGAFSDLFSVLQRTEIDAPLFFRLLADVPTDPTAPDDAVLRPLEPAWYRPDDITGDTATALVTWLRSWGARTQRSGLDAEARRQAMHRLNPRYVLRNALAQEAIDAATNGDTAFLHDLWEVLRRPYDDQPGAERFGGRRPEWARHRVGCSMLSCSS